MQPTSTTGLKGMIASKMFGKKKKMPAKGMKDNSATKQATSETPDQSAPQGIAVGYPKKLAK